MDCLSQELVEIICGFLTLDDLKNTVTVSHSFQYASEKASGAYAVYELTRDNAQTFTRLYSGRRWGYLRHLRYRTRIPDYHKDYDQEETGADESAESHACRESPQELQEKDEIFTKDINLLFQTLRTIEDRTFAGKLQLDIYTPYRYVQDEACPHRKCISWRVHLLDPEKLPELTSVRALRLANDSTADSLKDNKSSLMVDLRTLIDLAVKFPQLEYIGCQHNAGSGWTTDLKSAAARHYLKDWPGPLRDSRHDFAKRLEGAELPATLREVQFDFLHPPTSIYQFPDRMDQTESLPNCVSPAAYDPFSSSLRLMSHQLRKLELKVVADKTLFWPIDGTAAWPHLESICVEFHVSSPSGSWYFEGPKGHESNEEGFEITEESYPPTHDTSEDADWDEEIEDYGLDTETVTCRMFRVVPNDEMLVPFLTSFAKAAFNMPSLKEACLWAPLRWDAGSIDGYENYDCTHLVNAPDRPFAWGITYIAPATFGFHPRPGQHYSRSRQIWWTTGRWQPDEKLRKLFQMIGDQDTELIEYGGHEKFGKDKLALRPLFEQFQIFGRRHPESQWPIKDS